MATTFVDEEEPPSKVWIVTCHTDGCPMENESYPLRIYLAPEPPLYRAYCGKCCLMMWDLVDPDAPAPEEPAPEEPAPTS